MRYLLPAVGLAAALLLSTTALARSIDTFTTLPAAVVNLRDVTSGDYQSVRLYLPGKWRASTTGTGSRASLTFIQGVQKVEVLPIQKDECGYQLIRIEAQEAWGGESLDQAQAQLQNVVLGRNYRAYSWVMPGLNGGKNYHWCMGQGSGNSVEIVASSPSRSLLEFLRSNFVKQLAVRRGR